MKRARLASCAVLVGMTLVVAADGPPNSAVAATPGSVIWEQRYDGPDNSFDQANDVVVAPDGSTVFVTGVVHHALTDDDYGTIAYDASTGVIRWSRRYGGAASSSDRARAIAVSPDGSTVFVTGSAVSSTSRDHATVAYDASSGVTLWTTRYDGPGEGRDEANALGVSPDGATVFVTGYGDGSTTGRDYATAAYDAATGRRLWSERYDGTGTANDVAEALAVSPDGSEVFVTGRSRGPRSGTDYATVAYRADTGAQRWVRRYDGPDDGDPYPNDDGASSLGVSPDGAWVYVTGYGSTSSGAHDFTTIAYDAVTGAKRWLRRYDGPGGYTDQANALAVSPDGSSVFVTGYDYVNATGYDYATVAYDAATGARRWVRRYVGPAIANDEANDIGVSPGGSTVIVTGTSYRSEIANDYLTLAYDATTGARLWTRRYNDGRASDDSVATALAVSASAVFVTGRSRDPSSGVYVTDYATVAYALT